MRKDVTITLLGNRPAGANQLPPPVTPNYKGINVDGPAAVLSLHGHRYYKTWTRLAYTLEIGSTKLFLQTKVNWEKNQQIVVLTSIMEDSRVRHENEIFTITSIWDRAGGPGSVVVVDKPAQYRHVANEYYQVEVGLLTRKIAIQGSPDDSEPTDPDPGTCMHPWSHRGGYNKNTYSHFKEGKIPCFDKELTGYGGHIIIQNGAVGQVEGVELYRMGQTNVKARYPMHFHLLQDCPSCYFQHSSVHRSFYRCVAIHGTNHVQVTENVAYDVTGHCYYLEDGVEENNVLAYNLGGHVHTLAAVPGGLGQSLSSHDESDDLRQPADVAAAAFYISNLNNRVIGNAASGGWTGFAMPNFETPTGEYASLNMKPANRPMLEFDGNTAHSTGYWWRHGSGFYNGGALHFVGSGATKKLRYQPGRYGHRKYCLEDQCSSGDCNKCPRQLRDIPKMTNNKAFMVAGAGLNSWNGDMEIHSFEAFDVSLGLEAISHAFWIDDLYVMCRTGEPLGLYDAKTLEGTGFRWYDTQQSHIITNAVFRHCGYRSDDLTYYGTSATRGCGDDPNFGCKLTSTVWGFMTHSDQHTPELMQGTKNLDIQECGRRFLYTNSDFESVSSRGQNWVDVDGTASGLGEPTLIGSGMLGSKDWWDADDETVFMDYNEGPVSLTKQNNGPERHLGHVYFEFDPEMHKRVGKDLCGNSKTNPKPCPTLGYIRHLGHRYSPYKWGKGRGLGMPVTANPSIAGLTGGYGWLLDLEGGAPRKLVLREMEVFPGSPLMLSIPYPKETKVTIKLVSRWCKQKPDISCEEVYHSVESIEEARQKGNAYYVDPDGIVTFRVIQPAERNFIGRPDFFIPTEDTPGLEFEGELALSPFVRGGVHLPEFSWGTYYEITADCAGTGPYCDEAVYRHFDPDVCPAGYEQLGYDRCCKDSDSTDCVYAGEGTTSSS